MIEDSYLGEVEGKLAAYSPQLAGEYRAVAERLRGTLSDGDFRTWTDEGVALASHSLRSWEAAVEYFRVSPEVLHQLQPAAFRRWAHAGRDLAEYSSVVAGAFFKASPATMPYLDERKLTEWAALGQRLY
ncbi:MAG TPA: hypothetical protein VFY79_03970, partial [Dehalococcoidia bacterium]|nr:hypothetical protein [Dehalococcoidia bacterium]